MGLEIGQSVPFTRSNNEKCGSSMLVQISRRKSTLHAPANREQHQFQPLLRLHCVHESRVFDFSSSAVGKEVFALHLKIKPFSF